MGILKERPLLVAVSSIAAVLLIAIGWRSLSAVGGSHAGHTALSAESNDAPVSLVGQYAFATIAEIVALLDKDPDTDWSRVDIAALREHLLDMHRVTLQSEVMAEALPDGVRFAVTADNAAAIESIRRMSSAHTMTMSDDPSLRDVELEPIDGGVELTWRIDDPAARERLLALGFHGYLALGNHHPRHHLTLARGLDPHEGH